MIGQHPQAFGLPEVNLFIAETLDQLCQKATQQRQFLIHGLLRTVAHLYAGEQTVESIAMAWRWINRRREMTTGAIYRELCRKVAPRRLVDKSPTYSQSAEILERIEREFPDAQYLFLTRNPIDQGNSMIQSPQGFMQLLVSRSLDFNENPPRVEPQFQWLQNASRHSQLSESATGEPPLHSARRKPFARTGTKTLRDLPMAWPGVVGERLCAYAASGRISLREYGPIERALGEQSRIPALAEVQAAD